MGDYLNQSVALAQRREPVRQERNNKVEVTTGTSRTVTFAIAKGRGVLFSFSLLVVTRHTSERRERRTKGTTTAATETTHGCDCMGIGSCVSEKRDLLFLRARKARKTSMKNL